MNIIVVGSRSYSTPELFKQALTNSGFQMTGLVSSGNLGLDRHVEKYAEEHKIPIYRFSLNKKKFGRAADLYRNMEMVSYADAVIAIWNGKSVNTRLMLEQAYRAKLKIYVELVKCP